MKVIDLLQQLQKIVRDSPALQYIDVSSDDMIKLEAVTVERLPEAEAPVLVLTFYEEDEWEA